MKGTVLDLAFMIVILLAMGVTILIAYEILTDFKDNWANVTDDGPSAKILEKGKAALGFLNHGFVIVLIALGVAIILGAFLIRTHPAFFIISFFALVLLLLVAPQFSNMFNEIASAPELVAAANQFPIMVTLMRNLPLIILLFGAAVMIVIYGKIRKGEEEI